MKNVKYLPILFLLALNAYGLWTKNVFPLYKIPDTTTIEIDGLFDKEWDYLSRINEGFEEWVYNFTSLGGLDTECRDSEDPRHCVDRTTDARMFVFSLYNNQYLYMYFLIYAEKFSARTCGIPYSDGIEIYIDFNNWNPDSLSVQFPNNDNGLSSKTISIIDHINPAINKNLHATFMPTIYNEALQGYSSASRYFDKDSTIAGLEIAYPLGFEINDSHYIYFTFFEDYPGLFSYNSCESFSFEHSLSYYIPYTRPSHWYEDAWAKLQNKGSIYNYTYSYEPWLPGETKTYPSAPTSAMIFPRRSLDYNPQETTLFSVNGKHIRQLSNNANMHSNYTEIKPGVHIETPGNRVLIIKNK